MRKPCGTEKELMGWANDPLSSANSPDEPKNGIEHDFRMMPSRISARRFGASWILYEKEPNKPENILAFRPDWTSVWQLGMMDVAMLDGKTVLEYEASHA